MEAKGIDRITHLSGTALQHMGRGSPRGGMGRSLWALRSLQDLQDLQDPIGRLRIAQPDIILKSQKVGTSFSPEKEVPT